MVMRNSRVETTHVGKFFLRHGDPLLTQRLRAYFAGNLEDVNGLLREIFPKLCEIAYREVRQERYRYDFSPTELINEVWLRSISKARWSIRDQHHFYAIASLAMRRVLIDVARKRAAEQRRDAAAISANVRHKDAEKFTEIRFLVDELENHSPDTARIIDMHYFAGYTFIEIAQNMGLTVRQVRLRWEKGINWLKQHHGTLSCAE